MTTYFKVKSTLRLADLAGVSNRIVAFLNGKDLRAHPEFAVILPMLIEQTEALTVAMDRDKIESELADLDAMRDSAVRSLGAVIKGFANMPVDAVQTAAKHIKGIFDKYGVKIADYRYDAESGKITSLLKDLESPEAQTSIEALPHLEKSIANLQKAQADFEAKKIEYDQAKELRKESSKSASEIKPALLDTINNQLVNFYTGVAKFRDDEFRNIADTINSWIVDANDNTQNN
ncbi:MAG: DUF6261 family protein [Bacteroidales bacterium]